MGPVRFCRWRAGGCASVSPGWSVSGRGACGRGRPCRVPGGLCGGMSNGGPCGGRSGAMRQCSVVRCTFTWWRRRRCSRR
jgi:hypothetical protein